MSNDKVKSFLTNRIESAPPREYYSLAIDVEKTLGTDIIAREVICAFAEGGKILISVMCERKSDLVKDLSDI